MGIAASVVACERRAGKLRRHAARRSSLDDRLVLQSGLVAIAAVRPLPQVKGRPPAKNGEGGGWFTPRVGED